MKYLAILSLCLGGLGLGLLAGGCASSPSGAVLSGRFDATAFGDIPEGAAIAVEPADSTHNGMRRVLIDALTARGISTKSDAPLVMSYHAAATPATPRFGLPRFGLAGVVGSSGTRDVGVSLDLPIFGLGDRSRGHHRYAVEVTVADREGRRLWRGSASGIAATGDLGAIAPAIVPALLQLLGHSARGRDLEEFR